MSGGHWDYRQYNVRETLLDVGMDGEVVQRFPKLAQIFRDLGKLIDDTMHSLDWDLSCDSTIKNDEDFERIFIQKIGEITEKKYTVKVYEVSEDASR